MMYEKERADGVPCRNEQCCYWHRDSMQCCDGELRGECAAAACDWYDPANGGKNVALDSVKTLLDEFAMNCHKTYETGCDPYADAHARYEWAEHMMREKTKREQQLRERAREK